MQSGILVVDKPSGWTSHQVVGRCRRLLGTRKVGHAGTLDPMATGVLVVGIDRATKILGLLTATDKSYSATIRLGQTTSRSRAVGRRQPHVQGANRPAPHRTPTDVHERGHRIGSLEVRMNTDDSGTNVSVLGASNAEVAG